jgi:hypothetical protein
VAGSRCCAATAGRSLLTMPTGNPIGALYWLAVDLDTDSNATCAGSSDPSVSAVARIRAEARAQAFREAAARLRIALRGDQGADS